MNLHILKMFMLISVLILFDDVVAAPTGPGYCGRDECDKVVEDLDGHLDTEHGIHVQRIPKRQRPPPSPQHPPPSPGPQVPPPKRLRRNHPEPSSPQPPRPPLFRRQPNRSQRHTILHSPNQKPPQSPKRSPTQARLGDPIHEPLIPLRHRFPAPVRPRHNPDNEKSLYSPDLIPPQSQQSPTQARPIHLQSGQSPIDPPNNPLIPSQNFSPPIRTFYDPDNPRLCPGCGMINRKVRAHIFKDHPDHAEYLFSFPQFQGDIKCRAKDCFYRGKRSAVQQHIKANHPELIRYPL